METNIKYDNEMSNLIFSGLKAVIAVHKIQVILAEKGIGKTRKVESNNDNFPKYAFRSIEDFYNVISPLLAEHGLLCIPNVLRKKHELIESGKEPNIKRQYHVWIDVEYTLICVEDGSFIKGVMTGEAIDSGDKASSKALSYAHKYFYQQLFSIPTTTSDSNQPYANFNDQQQMLPTTKKEVTKSINSKAHWKATPEQINGFIQLLNSLDINLEKFLKNRNIQSLKGVTLGFIEEETRKVEKYMKDNNLAAN